MGKTFDTKRKILGMLRSGPKTPSEIWRELSLAPSTVSQHLKELRDMGEIEEGYDEGLPRRDDVRETPRQSSNWFWTMVIASA